MNIFLKSILAGLAVTAAGYFIVIKKKEQKTKYNAALLLKTNEKLNEAKKDDLLAQLSQRAYRISANPELKFYEADKLKVNLTGVNDTSRLKDLFSGSSKLEIWEAYLKSEVISGLRIANEIFKRQELAAKTASREEEIDTSITISDKLSEVKEVKKAFEEQGTEGINKYLHYENYDYPTALIGYLQESDTINLFPVLRATEVLEHMPKDVKFVLGKTGYLSNQKYKGMMELYAIKTYNHPNEPFLSNKNIAEARQDFNAVSGKPTIIFQFKNEGARIWERLTEKNVNRPVAIIIDNIVMTAPTILGKISGGAVEITGDFTVEQAAGIASRLDSEELPSSLTIISKKISRAGPSLSMKTFLLLLLCFILGSVAAFVVFRLLKATENK